MSIINVHNKIEFAVLDMTASFPYKANSYDAVFANLWLHYYEHDTTKAIAGEIGRVVRDRGIEAIACKSWDSLHIKDLRVAADIFTSPDGQTLHFFSREYMLELLTPLGEVRYVDEIEEEYNGRQSKIVQAIVSVKK